MPSIFQSALHPAGLQAGRIGVLWWIMFAVCAAVYLAVSIAVVLAVRRSRSHDPHRPGDRQLLRGVTAATAVSLALLLGLLSASVVTGRAIASLEAPGGIVVKVTGSQWWWQIEYFPDDPARMAVTANELHVPVGRPLGIKLMSKDVIHSLWIPNLHGKRDLVPGRDAWLWLQADKPGVYRGQCAEYCGLQHAHMALVVVAESAEEFDAWLAAQRRSAVEPSNADEARGRHVFETTTCAMCHTVRGTPAGGRLGPDLTHVASRRTLAAGTAPNTRGHLAGWIADSQHLKPGNRMPSHSLVPEDLEALLDYLESLR